MEGAAASRLCCRHRKLAISTSKASSSPYLFKKSEGTQLGARLCFPVFSPAIACCVCLCLYSDSASGVEEVGSFLLVWRNHMMR